MISVKAYQAGPLWQPTGCDVGLELSWSGPFDIAAQDLRHVSVNPITSTHCKNLASNEGPFSRQQGERDPCLSFPAQVS